MNFIKANGRSKKSQKELAVGEIGRLYRERKRETEPNKVIIGIYLYIINTNNKNPKTRILQIYMKRYTHKQ